MYRVGITKKDKAIISKNFNSKFEAENWILEIAEKYELIKAIIVNKDNIQDRETVTFGGE